MPRKEKVTRVIDGDTFETASRKSPVRLANVNAPGLEQPNGAIAKKLLEEIILEKTLEIETVGKDKDNRSIAKVRADGKSVNRAIRKRLHKLIHS